MGIFGNDNLPEGYTIRESTDPGSKKTEYTVLHNGNATFYTTFDRKLAVRYAKEKARLNR